MNAGRLGGDVRAVPPPSYKRGARVQVVDIEKGPLANRAPRIDKPKENTWVQRLWGNDWK